MIGKKVVLILGAGATVSDVNSRPLKSRPPLDSNFFSISKSANGDINKIQSYMYEIYNVDILNTNDDSLEKIMTVLYTDINDPALYNRASDVFRSLIYLFNRRLAITTNNIKANTQRFLYRIIVNYLREGVNPNNIAIITFNQDLQIEKTLNLLEGVNRWKSSGKIFNFPFSYQLDVASKKITSPKNSKHDLFDVESSETECIKILKLHGSLNWYSTHQSLNASITAMFEPSRDFMITRRKSIDPEMKYNKTRRQHTIPVIIPPVTHKSLILHNDVKKLWSIAEKSLKEAEELIIFGYSCPQTDFESINLIQRALRNNKNCNISVIDPDSKVLKHYVDFIKPERIFYYKTAKNFLDYNI